MQLRKGLNEIIAVIKTIKSNGIELEIVCILGTYLVFNWCIKVIKYQKSL